MDDPVADFADKLIRQHDLIIAKIGGAPGLRDRGLLEAAVGRVEMATHYAPEMPITEAAGMLAHSILKNHPFIDGNKRTAFAAVEMVLGTFECVLDGDDLEIADAFVEFAASSDGHEPIAEWIAERVILADAEIGAVMEGEAVAPRP